VTVRPRPTIHRVHEPTVSELVECRALPLDVPGSRSLVVRWSDGTTSEAVRFYADGILFSEGGLAGKARAESGALRQPRDVEFLSGG
jgi:hypothetical protein